MPPKQYLARFKSFYPHNAMLATVLSYGRVSVCHKSCSVEVVGRIELVFGMEASFDQSYTVF